MPHRECVKVNAYVVHAAKIRALDQRPVLLPRLIQVYPQAQSQTHRHYLVAQHSPLQDWAKAW